MKRQTAARGLSQLGMEEAGGGDTGSGYVACDSQDHTDAGGEEKGSLENRGTGGKSCVEVDGALPIHQALLRASHYSCCSPIGR